MEFSHHDNLNTAVPAALTGSGAQLQALTNQSSVNVPSEAAQTAQEAVAGIKCQLGLDSADPTTMQQQKPRTRNRMRMVTEHYLVPDRLVGLIIGKRGEQITQLEAESGCKVDIAPDRSRNCSLTGSPNSVSVCKQMIQQIIDRGNQTHMDGMDSGRGPEGNSGGVEVSIPGSMVGLIIGKGGVTIRQLQERANVKMLMIQDSYAPSTLDKTLLITGEPSHCQRAKEMVLELLAEKDMLSPWDGTMGTFNNFDGMHGGRDRPNGIVISVPRRAAGWIIGKGGKMIKKIQTETGAKVLFKPDDILIEDRLCAITGSPDKVQNAISMIQELLASFNFCVLGVVGDGSFGMGRGGFGDPNFQDQTQYSVLADKYGLVSGIGGETIHDISRQSGAHVELFRNPPPNIEEVFNIRGTPQQIQHAAQLIYEETCMQGFPGGPPGGPMGPGPVSHGPGGFEQFDQYGQPNQPPQQYGAPQGWNAYGNQYKQQPSDPTSVSPAFYPETGQPDYIATWAEYYQQQGMYHQANMILQQAQANAAPAVAGQPQQQQAP